MSVRLRPILCGCLAFAALLTGPVRADHSYRGFAIDESAVQGLPDLTALISATREQVDMVHAVELPAEVLGFFQGVKFRLVPAGTFKAPTPGRYTGRGDRSVEVSAGLVRIGHKPVLLHELLHAYHDQRIDGGFRNAAILRLFKAAQSIPGFAARSHMMANEKEYFACTATTFLFGETAQEPFRREKLSQLQPACMDYLKTLFGPDAGRYEGSLSRAPQKESVGRDL
jgi:hypothetical protein